MLVRLLGRDIDIKHRLFAGFELQRFPVLSTKNGPGDGYAVRFPLCGPGGLSSVEMCVHYFGCRPVRRYASVIQEDALIAHLHYGPQIVGHKYDGYAVFHHRFHLFRAFFLKDMIPYAQYLVDDKDFGVHVHGHGKAKARIHAGRVAFDRGIDEIPETREFHNFVELLPDLVFLHPEDRAVEKNILAAGEVRMETGAHFDESRHDAMADYAPFGRIHYPRQHLEDGALPGAVHPYDPEGLSFGNLERDVFQRPELVFLQCVACEALQDLTGKCGYQVPQGVMNLSLPEFFRYVIHFKSDLSHSILNSFPRKAVPRQHYLSATSITWRGEKERCGSVYSGRHGAPLQLPAAPVMPGSLTAPQDFGNYCPGIAHDI